jgi:hypothetical protein
MSYEKWHWRFVNMLARTFGLMSICAGLVFGASSVLSAQHPSAQEDALTLSGSAAVDFGIVAIFCLAIGALFVKIPAYRPDVTSQDRAGSRSWWTGEPKSR